MQLFKLFGGVTILLLKALFKEVIGKDRVKVDSETGISLDGRSCCLQEDLTNDQARASLQDACFKLS